VLLDRRIRFGDTDTAHAAHARTAFYETTHGQGPAGHRARAGPARVHEDALRFGTTAADHIACWFLPWASNHLTMIQRPPKIPTRLGGAPSSAVDPDLFFTAAISGCSVMVAGDAKSPFVTHGGTRTARSKTSDENALPQGCVFGVRDGAGSRSFYLQKTVTFAFTRLRKKKGFLSSSYVPANASLPPSQVKAILESYL